MIHRIDKIETKPREHSFLLEFFTKDFRHFIYSFSKRETLEKMYRFLKEERTMRQAFAFSYKLSIEPGMIDGWNVYDPHKEFSRQGALIGGWRLSSVNKGYKICKTYPELIGVPSIITDEELKSVATFRSQGRIPALTWYHKESGASVTRCAQPLVGINVKGKKHKDDHNLVEAILKANKSQQKKLMIVDLRPRANAEANRFVRGAGYEKNYKNCELRFMGIDNIHVIRNSFMKVMDLCSSTHGDDPNFYSRLESTNWLEHIRLLLVSARCCVDWIIRDKMSLLTHCSDGWDRTAQVT